jgi:hypothetical protein
MRELIILWILSAMNVMAPPHRHHYEVLANESYEQADARYREIAEAIVDESFAGTPVFDGRHARINTSMLVATMFVMESGLRRDVDLGIGSARLRHAGLNDFGRSWCMGQIMLGYKRMVDPNDPDESVDTSIKTTPEGWTGPELVADRRKCVRATINALKRSMSTCWKLPVAQQLSVYAAGNCESETGRRLSERRMNVFLRWQTRDRPKLVDEDVIKELRDGTIPLANSGTATTTTTSGIL